MNVPLIPSHSIQEKGRACEDCHANEAIKLIQRGDPVPMMVFKNGKMETWKGVVPIVHEKLRWSYFNKEGERWIPLETKEPEKVQWWDGKPITEEQIKKLSQPSK
jgi:hypothetical protein